MGGFNWNKQGMHMREATVEKRANESVAKQKLLRVATSLALLRQRKCSPICGSHHLFMLCRIRH